MIYKTWSDSSSLCMNFHFDFTSLHQIGWLTSMHPCQMSRIVATLVEQHHARTKEHDIDKKRRECTVEPLVSRRRWKKIAIFNRETLLFNHCMSKHFFLDWCIFPTIFHSVQRATTMTTIHVMFNTWTNFSKEKQTLACFRLMILHRFMCKSMCPNQKLVA